MSTNPASTHNPGSFDINPAINLIYIHPKSDMEPMSWPVWLHELDTLSGKEFALKSLKSFGLGALEGAIIGTCLAFGAEFIQARPVSEQIQSAANTLSEHPYLTVLAPSAILAGYHGLKRTAVLAKRFFSDLIDYLETQNREYEDYSD